MLPPPAATARSSVVAASALTFSAALARGEVFLRAGTPDTAMADATRALEVARSLQGGKPYSSLTGQSLLLEARIQEVRGDHAATRDMAGQALPNLVETLGEEHPDARRAAAYAHDVRGSGSADW